VRDPRKPPERARPRLETGAARRSGPCIEGDSLALPARQHGSPRRSAKDGRPPPMHGPPHAAGPGDKRHAGTARKDSRRRQPPGPRPRLAQGRAAAKPLTAQGTTDAKDGAGPAVNQRPRSAPAARGHFVFVTSPWRRPAWALRNSRERRGGNSDNKAKLSTRVERTPIAPSGRTMTRTKTGLARAASLLRQHARSSWACGLHLGTPGAREKPQIGTAGNGTRMTQIGGR